MGDVFRKLPKYGRFGKEISRYTSVGSLVPDDLTVRIWENHTKILEMQELLLPEQHTLLLDGVPRNLTQAGAPGPYPRRGADLPPQDPGRGQGG